MGINEQATFSEYLGGTGPQRAINEEGFRRLAAYLDSCGQRRLLPAPRDGTDGQGWGVGRGGVGPGRWVGGRGCCVACGAQSDVC